MSLVESGDSTRSFLPRKHWPVWAGVLLLLAGTLASFGTMSGCQNSSSRPAPVTREIVTTLTFPTGVSQPQDLIPVDAFPQLQFQQPVFVTVVPDGSERLCVVERVGRIQIFEDDPNVTSTTVFLDIADHVRSIGREEGLLGLAFDPDYVNNGYFYVCYIAGSPRRSVVSRLQVSVDPLVADESSELVLLEVPQPFENHNGGMLAFGPDGYLYISMGDGGSGGDPQNHGQDLTTLLGTVLRIRPEVAGGYAIPAGNPFVGAGNGVREEIWAYGLRNPWRFSFDSALGDLWLGDVGQGSREEVNVVRSGDNLGWKIYEGTQPFSNPLGFPPTAFTEPVHDYPRSLGVSVTGGYVYRGADIPSLQGAYLYGDFGSGRVWALVHDNYEVIFNTHVAQVSSISSFGEDARGEILVVSYGGKIYRLTEGTPTPPVDFPQVLSATGIFEDLSSLTPAAGIIEYDVNVPFWSDDAAKRRWIALPGISEIEFSANEAWEFPLGTVLVKHFEIETRVGDPDSVYRLETRVLIHETGGWAGYTYRWNNQQNEAFLLSAAETLDLLIEDPAAPGGQRVQQWYFPSPADCLSCHTSAAGFVLGVGTRQINREAPPSSGSGNQLSQWNTLGLFDVSLGPPTSYAAFPALGDATASLSSRARAYLDVNCAMCHQPGSGSPVSLDLRYEVALADAGILDQLPAAGDLGLNNARIVAPGDRSRSVLWERMRVLDGFRMPNVGSQLVDEAGVGLLGDWIDSL